MTLALPLMVGGVARHVYTTGVRSIALPNPPGDPNAATRDSGAKAVADDMEIGQWGRFHYPAVAEVLEDRINIVKIAP